MWSTLKRQQVWNMAYWTANGFVWPSPFVVVTARLYIYVLYQNVRALPSILGDSALRPYVVGLAGTGYPIRVTG